MTGDSHNMIFTVSKVMDLRLYALPLHYSSEGGQYPRVDTIDEFLNGQANSNLQLVYIWMTSGGIDLPPYSVCFEQCKILAYRMHRECIDFLRDRMSPQSCHPWWKDAAGMEAQSGVVIQKDLLTNVKYYDGVHDFLYMYVHCALKICNEVVVEGMCSVVAKHATSSRRLNFEAYAMESIIAYNAPMSHRSDPRRYEDLDLYFDKKGTCIAKGMGHHGDFSIQMAIAAG